ncbi:MAG: cytochrome c oxidase assembly protein [Hyphomonadaceae bacterium]
MSGARDPKLQRRMALTAAICVAVFAGMVGLAFAAPPLYRAFCQITGYGGTTQVAQRAAARVLDRTVQVTFDANVAPGLPIEFEPVQLSETVRLGETGIAFYRVRNLSAQPVTAVATFNVTPHKTGPYFQKLECFCFQAQTIAPGASVEMPVVYYVDPAMAEDPDTEEVRQITLSYTFFRSLDDVPGDANP